LNRIEFQACESKSNRIVKFVSIPSPTWYHQMDFYLRAMNRPGQCHGGGVYILFRYFCREKKKLNTILSTSIYSGNSIDQNVQSESKELTLPFVFVDVSKKRRVYLAPEAPLSYCLLRLVCSALIFQEVPNRAT